MLRWLRGGRKPETAAPAPESVAAPAAAPAALIAVRPVVPSSPAKAAAAKRWLDKAEVARLQGDRAAAIAALREALKAAPDSAHAHNNLGGLLRESGQADAALASFREAVRCDPRLAPAWFNLGTLLRDRGALDEAAAALTRSLELDPRQADAWYWIGNARMGAGDATGATSAYRSALRIDARMLNARWALTMAQIDPIPASVEAATASRASFASELDALIAWCRKNRPAEGFRSVGSTQPYYLAYQPEANAPLLRRYGELCTTLMRPWEKKVGLPAAPPMGGAKRRVGIVSAHFSNHSVWNAFVRGWVEHCDPAKVELHLFHTGAVEDAETAFARRRVHRFESGLRDWSMWAKTLADARLDVLVYPEVGMDAVTARLAAIRLAPVQLASWGHPETTGLPSIDRFVSAAGMEPADAASHYAERLELLPGLGCCMRRYGTKPIAADLRRWGIDKGTRVLLCPGVPFKYGPADDALWVDIARRASPCRLMFFRGQPSGLADRLEARLRTAFAATGIDFDAHVLFIPWQSQAAFFGLMQAAAVVLDSPGFSGFNTTMQAVECGTPVVAFEGRFLRGRFASGILRELGLEEFVASDSKAYVEAVLRLIDDSSIASRTRKQIAERGRALFERPDGALAMQRFVLDVSA